MASLSDLRTRHSGGPLTILELEENSTRSSVGTYGMPAGNRTNNVDATQLSQFTRQGSRFFGEPLHKHVARSQLAVKVCTQDKTKL